MDRFKLRKGKSLFDYIRDSIDIPFPNDFLPSTLMGWSQVRLIREPDVEHLEQFSTMLNADGQILCDTRYSSLIRSRTMPNCNIILAAPTDAPGLVIGGIIFVHLSDSQLSYVAALYVRRDFRGRRIGHLLYDEFQRTFDHPHRISFCDFVRSGRTRIRPSLFPVEGRYSILRVIGFAANISLAGSELLAAYNKLDERDASPVIHKFPGSFALEKVAKFDASVAGRNRMSSLDKLRHMEGFVGAVAENIDERVIGYAVSVPGCGSRDLTIGPVYAINLVTAVALITHLCTRTSKDSIAFLHVPHMGHRMLRFLHDKALCEVDQRFDRFYTHHVDTPVDDFSRVFAIAAKIALPDC